jgi:hypothetical protein
VISFVVIGTTLLWQMLSSALFVRAVDPMFVPNLGLMWVVVLADLTPSTPAREGDFWISGFAHSVLIGYIMDLSMVAPRGLYMSVYGVAFVILRLITNKLAQGNVVKLGITLAATSFGIDVVVWWIKGFITSFASVVSFSPMVFAFAALANALLGALLVPLMASPFDERNEGFR